MGFINSKPFSRAAQFRLVAMLTAAVFALCVKTVWHESTLLAFARGELSFNSAIHPEGTPVPTPVSSPANTLADGVVELDFSHMGPPNLWLIELEPNEWTITFENPEEELIPGSLIADIDLAATRSMGPFQAKIWTERSMGLWASTSYHLDHEFTWLGGAQHGLAIAEIRQIIADQWTTGGGRAINAFAHTNNDTPALKTASSTTPRLAGYALNAASLGSLLATLGFCFASFLIAQRKNEHTNPATGSTPQSDLQSSRRSAA